MQKKINDFVLEIATVNGSGSQSANNILLKSLFRMGIPVGGKNLFPSNIAGLPTWFTIRANAKGYTARREDVDIVVAMNAQTLLEDVRKVKPGGVFIYNSDLKIKVEGLRQDIQNIGVDFKQLVDQATDQIKIKKLLINMVYVGVLSHLLKIDSEILHATVKDTFKGKDKVLDSNFKALEVGRNYAIANLNTEFPYGSEKMNANQGKILVEGNLAAAMGMVFGGCTFVSWYPITPSSSVAENFISLAEKYRKDATGKNTFAVVQAEDELAAISMVAGASWAGARAMTATSGPGLSLMSEAAGLFYYAEIPGVIWDIQRVGPSTGLPTRTMQADITLAHYMSHGDTKHILLFPGTVEECFDFGGVAFDLAERLQTLVIVMSDLDLGMNYWIANEFNYPEKPFDRGKVLTAAQLDKMTSYQRYGDPDGDAISHRTLPGTRSDKAAFLTRGSGHNENAQYTESSPQYLKVLERIARKYDTARSLVPKPFVDSAAKAKVGIIAFGSSDAPMKETRDLLTAQNIPTDYLRLRALPFTSEVEDFIKSHERIYVVEQNRDGQMLDLLRAEYFEYSLKLRSVRHYDGLPIYALTLLAQISEQEKHGPSWAKKKSPASTEASI